MDTKTKPEGDEATPGSDERLCR